MSMPSTDNDVYAPCRHSALRRGGLKFPLGRACGTSREWPRFMPAYALTIFLGAFLLFQVQPLIAKYILPWFGGGPGVWTACMLFFQLALLAGYAYAHV